MEHQEIHKKFEELQKKAEQAKEIVIRLNAEIERSEEEQKKLKAEALEKYKTDDINQLANILDSMEAENVKNLELYEKEITALLNIALQKQKMLQSIKNGEALEQ